MTHRVLLRLGIATALASGLLVTGLFVVSAATTSSIHAGAIRKTVYVAVDTGLQITLTDATWTDIPGANGTITVPAKSIGTVDGRWAGVINQAGGNSQNLLLRLEVGPAEAQPAGSSAEGFNYGNIYLERSLGSLTSGTYVVSVQGRVVGPCVGTCQSIVNVSPSHLTVEEAKG